MATLGRLLSRLFLVLLFLLAVVAAIWGYGRLTSPTAAQQAAIALMQADPVEEGENGFPLLLALPDAPAGSVPDVLNCGGSSQPTCIAVIEAAPEAGAAAVESYRIRLEAAARALHAPVFRDLRTNAAVHDMPAYTPIMQLDSLRALDFAAGNTLGALSAACTDAIGAVRWARNPNTLLDGMIGIAAFRQHSALIADMRRRAPGDALPASCAALAEAPDAATEGTLCAAMRGEFRWLSQLLPMLEDELPPGSGPRWMTPLLHDVDWLLARTAERYAPICGPDAATAAREDRATGFAVLEHRWVDRIAFPASVLLDQIAEPAYQHYPERQLDFVAQRRLLAALLQMEAMDASWSNDQRFAALPAELRDGPRPLKFDAEANVLRVALRGRQWAGSGGTEAVLPLPPRDF